MAGSMVTWLLTPGRRVGPPRCEVPDAGPGSAGVEGGDPVDRLADGGAARGEAEAHRVLAGAVVEVDAGRDGDTGLLEQRGRVGPRAAPALELRPEVGPVVEGAVRRRRLSPAEAGCVVQQQLPGARELGDGLVALGVRLLGERGDRRVLGRRRR